MNPEPQAGRVRHLQAASLREFFQCITVTAPLCELSVPPVVADFVRVLLGDADPSQIASLVATRPRLDETEALMDAMYGEDDAVELRIAAAMLLFLSQTGRDTNPEARDMGLGLILALSTQVSSDAVRCAAAFLAACLVEPLPYRCLSMERLALAGLHAIAARKDAHAALTLLTEEREAYASLDDIGTHPPDMRYSETIRAQFVSAVASASASADAAGTALRAYPTSM